MSFPIDLMVVDLYHGDLPVDYVKMKAAGVVGIIFKASQGTSSYDPAYTDQRMKALAAGMLWGAYHYADNSAPSLQVHNFLTHAAPNSRTLMVLDYEDNGDASMNLSAAQTFVTMVEKETVRPNSVVLYSGNRIKETMTAGSQAFWSTRRLWLAQYSLVPKSPAPWAKPWLWQYSGDGDGPEPHKVDGVTHNVDCNTFDGTREELASQWA